MTSDLQILQSLLYITVPNMLGYTKTHIDLSVSFAQNRLSSVQSDSKNIIAWESRLDGAAKTLANVVPW